jgi:hypothetical protein
MVISLATRLVPNNISGLKIDVHCIPLGEVTVHAAGADHIAAVITELLLVDVPSNWAYVPILRGPNHSLLTFVDRRLSH